MNSLVPVPRSELAVGEPLSWPVYDVSNKLLMSEGVVIQNHRQLDALYEKGVYRNPAWDMEPQRQPKPIPMSNHSGEKKGHPSSLPKMKFSDMSLRLGDRIQLQEVAGEKARHVAKVVGYLDSHSLIVTHPTRNGDPLIFLDRQPLIVRGFSGKHAYAFETHLLKCYSSPYPHLHLASPKHVEKKEIRNSERVICNIVASVTAYDDPESHAHSAMMLDLSITGTKVVAKEPLGEKGGAVLLAFRSRSSISDEYLNLRGIIRCINLDAEGGGVLHGVEFAELQNSNRLILENMIYRLRLDDDVMPPLKHEQSTSDGHLAHGRA